MKFCKSFEVSSSYDLNCKLHSFYISVPPRGRGRKTEHTERWVTCRFLCTIANSHLLSYPLRVKSMDKPDLLLEIKTSKPKRVGVEITEAVSQFQANHDARIAQSDDSTDIHLIPEYTFIDQNLSSTEFKKRKKEFEEGRERPIMGNAVELNWKKAILGFVCKKTAKFSHPDFTHYPENWLLIYDNWSPCPPDSEVRNMINELSHSLFANDWQQPFDRVFILRFEMLWELNKDKHPISYRVTTPGSF